MKLIKIKTSQNVSKNALKRPKRNEKMSKHIAKMSMLGKENRNCKRPEIEISQEWC